MEFGHALPATIASALLIYLIYTYILYPIFFSPLSKIPSAHPLAPLTTKWFEYQATHSAELKILYSAHKTHGPIVRLAPNEVSVVSQEGLRKLYAQGLDKSIWWQVSGLFQWFGHHNMFSTLDHASHAEVKRVIAPEYTKSVIQRSEGLRLSSRKIVLERLLPKLRDAATEQKDVHIMGMFERTAVDFISNYLFGLGCGSDFLGADQEDGDAWTAEWAILRNEEGAKRSFTEDYVMRMLKAALKDGNSGLSNKLTAHFAMDADHAKGKEASSDVNDDAMRKCASEMMDHMIATQELLTIVWTYLTHHLCHRPELQTQLRAELQNLHHSIPLSTNETSTAILPSPSDLDALPILDAIINETIRLHGGNPARMPRVSPVNGMTLHGHFIPPNTKVSSNAYCVHRNPEAFPKPLEWRPERFLGDADWEGPEGWRKWYWPFGSGPRNCVGRYFTMQVLKLVVATIYTHFTTSIIKDDDIEQVDAWLSGPKSRDILLRFHLAEDNGQIGCLIDE